MTATGLCQHASIRSVSARVYTRRSTNSKFTVHRAGHVPGSGTVREGIRGYNPSTRWLDPHET